MFRLSSVNIDEEEQVIMEVQNFSNIAEVNQVGLMTAGAQGQMDDQAKTAMANQ